MIIKSVAVIYYSPTGSTKRVIEKVSKGLDIENIDFIDCTNISTTSNGAMNKNYDLYLIAVPVYYGRVPEKFVQYLSQLDVENKLVVPVVVYGNRMIRDALLELNDILQSHGFRTIASGAFIAEHSYSTQEYPIANKRPDNKDLNSAEQFGQNIKSKINQLKSVEDLNELPIPGERPFREPAELHMIRNARKSSSLTPVTDLEKCIRCSNCLESCPTNAIDATDCTKVDKWECILCFACIKSCPKNAKKMRNKNFNSAIREMHKECLERRSPELLI